MVKNSNIIKKVILIITLLTLLLITTTACTTTNNQQIKNEKQHLEPQVITLCKQTDGSYKEVIGDCNEK